MPQDATTGARANTWGHETARVIASRIGAEALSEKSNEFKFQGKRVTIRCARKNTTIVGVTYNMLERVESVIGAFQNQDDSFTLFEMPPAIFKSNMRDSKKEGKVGLVKKKVFEGLGRKILSWI